MSNDEWLAEHRKIYGSPSDPQKRLAAPKPTKTFPVTHVSQVSHDLILDLEQAYSLMAAAVGTEEVMSAYSNLCHRRRDLYELISRLEDHSGIAQTVSIRFD